MYTNHIFSFKSKQSQRKKMNNITIRDAFLKRLVLWNTKGQTTDYKNDGIHCNWYWMKRRGKLCIWGTYRCCCCCLWRPKRSAYNLVSVRHRMILAWRQCKVRNLSMSDSSIDSNGNFMEGLGLRTTRLKQTQQLDQQTKETCEWQKWKYKEMNSLDGDRKDQ